VAEQQAAQGADMEPQVGGACAALRCMPRWDGGMSHRAGDDKQGFWRMRCATACLLRRHADRMGPQPTGISRAQQGSRTTAGMRRALLLQLPRAAGRRGSERASLRARGWITSSPSAGRQETWTFGGPCQRR
jgi:hypothetical protein